MTTKLIRQVPLFAALPPDELDHLMSTLPRRKFSDQWILFHEGGSDDLFYILLKGEVEVIKSLGTPDERVMAVRHEGALLGEMSLFSQGGRHTASVRAHSPIEALEITREDFDALLNRQPKLAYEMVRIISRRLEDSENVTISDLREKNRQLMVAYQELKDAHEQIIEKKRLERELEIAKEIQMSILPQELPRHALCDFGARMIPARAVGGDLYDFISLGEDRWGLLVGDVSDKGVPSALFMALTYSLVRAEATRAATPGDAVRAANHHLLEINSSGMFVTLVYGVLDCATGRFDYVRAGHPHPVVVDGEGQVLPLPSRTGQPLGLFDDPLLDEQSIDLPAGSLVVLYSDGVSEAMDPDGEFFGVERLERMLARMGGLNAEQVCDSLWEQVKGYTGALPQQDDFTVLAVKRIRR